MTQTIDVRTPTLTPDAAFRHVAAVQSEEGPDLPLLEFAARLTSGANGGNLTMVAFPSDGVLRNLPAAVNRCAHVHGLRDPEVLLVTEPELEAVFPMVEEAQVDLLVMRCPRKISRRALSWCGCSVCLLPPDLPGSFSRILVNIDLDAAGRHLLSRAGRVISALEASELVALNIRYPEVVLCEPFSTGKEWKDLLHFVHRARPRGVSCTPLLEGSARRDDTLARVAAECGADMVIVGRRPGDLRTCDLRRLAEDTSLPILQLRLPGPTGGMRARLRQVFSHPEPMFG